MNGLPLSKSQLDVAHVLSTQPPEPDHVLPGLPVGAVGALVAPGGTGKTMLALQLAISLATGQPSPLQFSAGPKRQEPTTVVLIAAEETGGEMHRRLFYLVNALSPVANTVNGGERRREYHDLLQKHLRVYSLAGRSRLRLDGDESAEPSIQALKEVAKGARLLILDPMRQIHGGDENDSWAMTSLVQACQSIAHQSHCALLLTHHTTKHATMNGLGDQAGASRGSAALTDAVRWQVNLSRLDEKLAKQYGIEVDGPAHHIRADLAKANYLAAQPPLVFRKGEGGALELRTALIKVRRGRA
ncbi:helicase RepA family protein [Castellaniella sp.]|uniref:helicase RepA family protein n=1 Tax=Castellaniella sp. TaxID=1955812 RepID=UPI002AFF898A|nr:helicase RepA family protein [Castellaniella sp.]